MQIGLGIAAIFALIIAFAIFGGGHLAPGPVILVLLGLSLAIAGYARRMLAAVEKR